MVRFELNDINLVSDNERLIPRKDGRMVLSSKYRDYRELITLIFRSGAPVNFRTIKGRFGVRIKVRTLKDQSNLVKAVLDSLQDAEIVLNDRYCDRLFLYKFPIKRGEKEMMTIEVFEREDEKE